MVNAKKTPKEEEEKEKKRGGLILSLIMGDNKKINRWILPLIMLILVIFFGYYTGLFNSEKPDSNTPSEVYKFHENLTIGKNWSYNFSSQLTSLIQESLNQGKKTSTPYIFYTSSKSGPLPEGLVLNPANGVLAGKPTGNVGTFTFEVCVEDSMGSKNCKIYELNVGSKNNESSEGESTSSWTGTYTIERLGYYYEEIECKNKITGEIHFEITQKSNGEFEGIATTKNDKESITKLDEYGVCLPYLIAPLDTEGENRGKMSPFWLAGTINDAGSLNIAFFEIYMFEFSSFTANRVENTLISKHTEVIDEHGRSPSYETLTFSVTKDAE